MKHLLLESLTPHSERQPASWIRPLESPAAPHATRVQDRTVLPPASPTVRGPSPKPQTCSSSRIPLLPSPSTTDRSQSPPPLGPYIIFLRMSTSWSLPPLPSLRPHNQPLRPIWTSSCPHPTLQSVSFPETPPFLIILLLITPSFFRLDLHLLSSVLKPSTIQVLNLTSPLPLTPSPHAPLPAPRSSASCTCWP